LQTSAATAQEKIMPKAQNIINCPKCGAEINVSDVLYHQVEEKLQRDYENKNARRQREYDKKLKEIEDEKTTLAKQKESLQHQIDSAVQQRLKSETTQLEKKLRTQIEDEKSEQVKALETELKQKSEQVKDLNKTKADVARLQREKSELKEQIEADAERRFGEQLTKEREKIRSSEREKNQTELQKKEKLIEDLNKRLEDAQAKLEQGSSKLAGEVKEIELREFLKAAFPIDEIKDVPSGIKGADVIQSVRNNFGQSSGTILYERKQAQKFDDKNWIPKLKEDGRTTKADICVIVTKTMPPDNQETHFRDGVWVCTSNDIKIISALLRDGLIKQYIALASQSDKGTKMEMLYNYLIGNDFKNHILGILEAFRSMDKSLEKEREDAIRKFSEREAHIFKAKQSVLNFAGRIEGIASDSLNREIKMLEKSTKQLPTND
jgi:hypothetical protein